MTFSTQAPRPSRFLRSFLTATGFAAALNGCVYGELTPSPDTSASDSSEPTPAAPKPEETKPVEAPVETDEDVPLAGFASQTVQWFDKDVTLLSAKTHIHTQPGLSGEVYRKRTHVLELRVKNRTSVATETGSEHWDLMLSDGTRLSGELDSTEYGPHDAFTFTFTYADDADRALAGAHLELNGVKYGDYKPLIVPLDKAVTPEVHLNISELMGQVFTCDSDLGRGCWQHEVLSAKVKASSDVPYSSVRGSRAWPGKKLLELQVRTTGTRRTNLFEDVFHMMVNGYGVSNERYINEVPTAGEPIDLAVVFQIDENAQVFDVEFDTDAGVNETAWKSFRVDLSKATPAE